RPRGQVMAERPSRLPVVGRGDRDRAEQYRCQHQQDPADQAKVQPARCGDPPGGRRWGDRPDRGVGHVIDLAISAGAISAQWHKLWTTRPGWRIVAWTCGYPALPVSRAGKLAPPISASQSVWSGPPGLAGRTGP